MKKIAIFCALLVSFVFNSDAATPRNPRAQSSGTASGDTTTSTTRTQTARSATTTRNASATRSSVAGAAPARAATAGRTTVSRAPTASTSTNNTTARSATVAARAGSTQRVITTGTTVAAANENIVVSASCRDKYYGCMDSFCMLDNDNGGRCICSDKNAEYDSILAQIEELDQQSYQMATYGVERIEMGDAAETAIANANAVAQSILDNDTKEEKGRSLDLDSWFTPVGAEDEFADDIALFQSPVDGYEGDALFAASHQICAEQIPDCSNELDMLQLMYAQQIRSDCSAYENSLKQQKNASAQKLYAAEQALRDAALEQYQTANKYDLGQCTVEFKNCMITTAECGEDFSGCASVAAFDSTNTRGRGENSKNYTIKGAATEIQIKASTYDILMSKKPLCDTVTKQCQLVADQVWDTFLREVAPQVKSAELIAEDNVRQNCISEISSCFQQACRDTIDPNDPEGSYDMCLTRPETMLSLCTVPLNACGIDSADPEKSNDASAMIWDFVLARLESMRINSCTTQVKECLQSPDRCGQDYTQCIGLDTDTIIRMCPQDLLVGCQNYDGGDTMILSGDAEDDFYARLEPYVQGIILDIDNNLLTECQNAADQAMISVCGDTENCDNITIDEYIGSNTLEYKICQISGNAENTTINYKNCYTDLSQISDTDLGLHDTNGNSVERKNFSIIIEGEIPWENVLFDDEGKISITDDYIDTDARQKIESELTTLQNNINNAINAIESNPEVQFCTTGRIVQGLNDDFATKLSRAQAQSSANTARSVSDRTAQLSSLEVATANQTVIDRTGNGGRFPGLTQQMRSIIATSAIKRAMDNYRTKYEELEERRMQDYVTLNERIAEVNNENLLEARRDAAMVACVGTAEATTLKDDPDYAELYVKLMLEGKNDTTGNTADNATATNATEQQDQYVGTDSDNKWNYRETVTSTFSPTTLVCHRCIRVQNCATPKKSRKFCKKWDDPVETCKDIQF